MANELATRPNLVQDLKLFGGRIFEYTSTLDRTATRDAIELLRRAVAEAPRRLIRRAAAAGDERQAVRELHGAFKALSDVVDTLDRMPAASALAREGASLREEVFDLIP